MDLPLRDLLVTMAVFGSLPFIFLRPYIGILMWSWIGYMNPHRLTWSFAYNFPFAQVIGLATLASLFLSREPKRIPWNGVSVLLVALSLWMVVTTLFALYPGSAWDHLARVLKILLMAFVTMMVMNHPERVKSLVWVIAISLGFYGIKGGLFALRTGGEHAVIGPAQTFIGGNTALALAMIMVLPLLRFLHLHTERQWLRWGLVAAMVLTGLAIIASYSRGAFLAAACMLAFLWLKSRYKGALALAFLLLLPVGLGFMPQKYFDKMETILHYQQDDSAQGRLDAWTFATKMALARPLVGGGFESFAPQSYHRFAPDVIRENERYQDAHSIWFEMLGEHGFVGLGLFLATGLVGWRTATRVIQRTRERPELKWAGDLAAMVQVSLVGYATAGTFLGLAYFDFYYHLLAILVILQDQVAQAEGKTTEQPAPAAAPQPQPGLASSGGPGHAP
jgi:probable O-glycosylation ligase (exosortase A-associated)